jgi:hypothetical protein
MEPEQIVPKDDQLAIVVLTSETVETILSRGGTGDWSIEPKNGGHPQICRVLPETCLG